MSEKTARRFLISGEVQGVGYRFFAQIAAERTGILGHVCNLKDGRVEVFAQGTAEALTIYERMLAEGPPFSAVERVDSSPLPLDPGLTEFSIVRHDM